MKEKRLLAIFLTILHLTTSNPRYTALNFGNDYKNYILFKPDMEPLQNEFTLCSWVKSLQDDGWTVHTWLSYATEQNYNEIMIGDNDNEIMIRDNGNSFLFDTQLDPSLIRYHFTDLAGRGIWYHFCTRWSFSTRTQKFYLNGNKIGETTTPEGRKLGVGGYLAIGSDQDSYGGVLNGLTDLEVSCINSTSFQKN